MRAVDAREPDRPEPRPAAAVVVVLPVPVRPAMSHTVARFDDRTRDRRGPSPLPTHLTHPGPAPGRPAGGLLLMELRSGGTGPKLHECSPPEARVRRR
ncbi:hypothetical protein GCM10025792_09250 [Pseudonocardia tropica]